MRSGASAPRCAPFPGETPPTSCPLSPLSLFFIYYYIVCIRFYETPGRAEPRPLYLRINNYDPPLNCIISKFNRIGSLMLTFTIEMSQHFNTQFRCIVSEWRNRLGFCIVWRTLGNNSRRKVKQKRKISNARATN